MKIFTLIVLVFVACQLSFSLKTNFARNSLSAQRTHGLKVESTNFGGKENHHLLTVVLPTYDSLSYFEFKPKLGTYARWKEVLDHIAEKLTWDSDATSIRLNIVDIEAIKHVPITSDVFVLIGLADSAKSVVESIISRSAKAIATFDCDSSIKDLEIFGDFKPSDAMEPMLQIFDDFLKNQRRKQRNVHSIAQDMWSRRSADDLLFMILVMIDTFTTNSISSVQSVTSTESTSLQQLACMCSNCSEEMIGCFSNEQCRKALDCLNSCKGNDQVCSYRCITSHETKAFEKFALCILQKNNCMGNTASNPTIPNPDPMSQFRGQPLTHEIAEGIFIGHLRPRIGEESPLLRGLPSELEPWSWKVVCGQNPAYDYFGCQHQIFYKDKTRAAVMWYDPVFKVTTLDGTDVWRRRHYRVRRGKAPGQFYFTVLDNGVTSSEFWRILDCADDMSWAVFYYGGAAAAAGTSYRGALVVTRDGRWPVMTPDTQQRISAALGRGGIKMWELFEVSNNDCGASCAAGPPPLGID